MPISKPSTRLRALRDLLLRLLGVTDLYTKPPSVLALGYNRHGHSLCAFNHVSADLPGFTPLRMPERNKKSPAGAGLYQ